MFTRLMLGTGVFWTLTYSLIIRQGFKDETYGMPFAALCANLSWEFIFSFIYPHSPIQRVVNIIWFLFDLVILFQFLKYGSKEFKSLSKTLLYTAFFLALLVAFCLVFFVTYEFKDFDGVYTAFAQTLIMSILFITMLYHRDSLRGQSIWIAICKLIGTAFASISFYFFYPKFSNSPLMLFLYIAILVFDLIYIGYVYWYRNPHREYPN